MSEVSLVRLYILRATYLLIAVGLALTIWPLILAPSANVSHMSGVVRAVLGAVSLLALIGIRYPLKMLPLLFFEFLWKAIWLIVYGYPLWRTGRLDPATTGESWGSCLVGVVIVAVVMPWGYMSREFVSEPGDRWANRASSP